MTKALKIRKVGNSAAVTLPKEVLEGLRVDVGDVLYLSLAANGIVLTPYDAEVERQMEAYQKVSRQYRETFRELAK